MASANPYDVVVQLSDGAESVQRTYAYNAYDAVLQILAVSGVLWPGEEIKVARVGPPPEMCVMADLERLLGRLAPVTPDPTPKQENSAGLSGP